MDLLAHLEAFVAVADHEGFTRAAETSGVPQPLLSRRLKQLEAYLGQPLLHREGRRVELSTYGAALLEPAREVVGRAERFVALARGAAAAGAWTLGVPPGGDPPALAAVIRAGGERDLAVSIRELGPGERAEALADGSLNAAVLVADLAEAELVVALGLARARPWPAPTARRGLHLDELRARRRPAASVAAGGAAGDVVDFRRMGSGNDHSGPRAEGARAEGAGPVGARAEGAGPVGARAEGAGTASPRAGDTPPVVLLGPEDDAAPVRERLRAALDRAGLTAAALQPCASLAAAAAQAHAGSELVLCDAAAARSLRLEWAPLADATLARGYRVRAAPSTPGARRGGDELGWLSAPLRRALHARAPGPAAPEADTDPTQQASVDAVALAAAG